MNPIVISRQTARRFILGKQGLWPGRRWKGKRGAAQALRLCEAVQLDPLNVVARSQDIVLHSRVIDYRPGHLSQLIYRDRRFFEYGGALFVYPISDLPYMRVHMERRSHDKRVEDFVFTNPELFQQVRAELRKQGPLGNRDLDGDRVGWNYRGRKETSLALFDMWLTGELMIHHREGFERMYDFRQNVVPPEYDRLAGNAEAEAFFALKAISFMGLFREKTMKTSLQYDMYRKYSAAAIAELTARLVESGMAARVRIEGKPEIHLAMGSDLRILSSLERGGVPKEWRPKETTTLEEVTFLAPLDIVSARGRAKKVFDFDYVWEVYKPAHQRRWGYYTLPILYGDDLVARLDPKLDRTTMTLEIRGFWHEDDAPVETKEFADALARGLIRFARFLQAERVSTDSIRPPRLRKRIERLLRRSSLLK